MHLDGNTTPFVDTTSLNTSNTTLAALFADIAGGSFWTGSAQDVLNYNRTLLPSERQLVEGYIAAKWNLRGLLPVDHPYKSSMPINQAYISVESGSGYFGSTYTSTSNVSGQWHADGLPIPDATSKTYIMTAANEGKIITWVDEFGPSNQIQMWTPSQLGSKLVCWYDAAEESTFTYGTNNQVASWANKVSGAVPAIQTNAAKRPIRDPDGLATGLPAVVANGINQQFTMASGFALNDQSAFAVMKTTDTKTSTSWWLCPGIWGNDISGTPADFGWGLQQGKPIYGAGSTVLTSVTFVNTGLPIVLFMTKNSSTGSTSLIRNSSALNNGSTQTGTRVLTNGITSMFQMVASNSIASGSSTYLAAAMSEFIIINQVIAGTERTTMEAYTMWRWNIGRGNLTLTSPNFNNIIRIL
jgi:hypothetical protein